MECECGFKGAHGLTQEHEYQHRYWAEQQTIPDQYQLIVARDTLKMPDLMISIMGGPTRAEARATIRKLAPQS